MPQEYENRARLIACAKAEFLEKGFTKASLRNISSAAGLTTGAVYFFFKDKNGLLGAVVDEPLKNIQNLILRHFSEEQEEDFTSYIHESGDHDDFARELIHVLYADYDAVIILLEKSTGSVYEGVVDRMIEMTDSYYVRLAQKYAEAVPGKKVNEYMLHWFSHLQIEAFVHMITHVSDERTALKEIRPVMDMLVEAWMNYILE